jgi:hypothetical protein
LLGKRAIREVFIGRLIITIIAALILFYTLIFSIIYRSDIFNFDFTDISQVLLPLTVLFLLFSSLYILLSLPSSLKIKFKRPKIIGKPNPVYGFFIMLAIGVGSTLGSPLFILIPENAVQFGIISTVSLVTATVTSILMARVYFHIYEFHKSNNRDIVGGPAFVKEAYGSTSLRYFVSRISMWVANSALSAYCVIIFFDLLFTVIPSLEGVSTFGKIIEYSILALFVVWFAINAFFETKFLRLIGRVQLIMLVVMAGILIAEEAIIFHAGSTYELHPLYSFTGNWFMDILIDSGYLFILFFGFQEIMAFQRNISNKTVIKLPGKTITMNKNQIIEWSMIATVIISASINIAYSVSVLYLHPSASDINSSSIPAFYIADLTGGHLWTFLMIIAFIIATLTTFVPSFMAASRHLRSLGEDRIFPFSITRFSWVFTLIFIVLLSAAGEELLLSITDFMVLMSLGLIMLSVTHYSRELGKFRGKILPITVSLLTFIFGLFNYFITPEVILFAVLIITGTYFIHNLIDIDPSALKLFIASLMAILFLFDLFIGNIVEKIDLKGSILNRSFGTSYSFLILLIFVMMVVALVDFILEWRLTKGEKLTPIL